MPELVPCPHCGCKVQMAEALLGRGVRCFACGRPFRAEPRPDAPPPLRPRAVADERVPPRRRPPGDAGPDAAARCPACDRAVGWRDRFCPGCGLEFDDDRGDGREAAAAARRRRDALPHRGDFLFQLSKIALVTGVVSICLCGVGAVVSVPVGVAVIALARHDLALMRAGVMDAAGQFRTEAAQTNAALGVILGVLFAALYAFGSLHRLL